MIELVPYLKVNCDAACADAGCDACGVELNPWHAYTIQAAQEALGTPLIPDMPSRDMASPCSEFEPAESGSLPSSVITGGTYGWWYDAAVPVVSDRAAGFVMRSLTLQDPMQFTASRQEKLRSRVCLLPGLVLGEMVVEVVGADVRSTKWLARQVKARLEGIPSTCFTSVDLYADCCVTSDGDTGLRRLNNVGEFFVEEIEGDTGSAYGTLISILFSADAMMEMPDGTLTSGAGAALGSAIADYSNTTSVNITEYASKTFYQADLELQTDGTLKLCPVDFSALDAVTDYLTIREVRAADAVTNPCSTEIDLDLTGAVPRVTPLQPDLWQSLILDPLVDNGVMDCTNPPTVRQLTVRNPRYLPNCPNCPDDARQRVCAETTGMVVTDQGLIDWAASGIDPLLEYVYDGTPANNDPALDKILSYWQCLGLTAESDLQGAYNEGLTMRKMWDLQGYMDDADDDEITSPDGSSTLATTVTHVGVTVNYDGLGYTRISVGTLGPPVAAVNASYIIRYYDMPGLNLENSLSTNCVTCGPGEAEYIGSISEQIWHNGMLSTNATLTKLAGVTDDGLPADAYDVCTWDVPGLTKTVYMSLTGITDIEPIAAMNHSADIPWTMVRRVVPDPTPTAFSSYEWDLYEDDNFGVPAGTIDANTSIGWWANPVYDVANDRMLIIGAGKRGDAAFPNLWDEVTIYEWGAGAVLTQLDSVALSDIDLGGGSASPKVFEAMVTPTGGVFFNMVGSGMPTASLTYWNATDGFAIELATTATEFSGRAGSIGMTPDGVYTYWDWDAISNAGLAVQIDETALIPDLENTNCTPPGGTQDLFGNGGPGAGFERGFAVVYRLDDAYATGEIYITNHAPCDEDPCGDVPDHCLPYITVNPGAGSGGPCVNITLSPVGSAISDVNPLINDLTRARFEFGPCSDISTPGCPGVIPPDPVVTVDTVAGTATPVGWSPGYQWPAESEGDQYTVSTVDAVANLATGVPTVVPTDVITVPSLGCTPPCAVPPIIYSAVISPDCWVPSIAQTIDLYTITGLSTTTRYRPEWSVEAVEAMVQPQVFLWYGLAADPAPTLGTISGFLGSKATPTRVKALELNQIISLSPAGLRITCGPGETADALTEGWIDATDVWAMPDICGAETAYLMVARTTTEAQPTVTFQAVPIGTP